MEKGTVDITPEKYAELAGCSIANVTKHLRKENFKYLPHIIRVKKYSRFYVLEVPETLTKDSFLELKSNS